jgi:hypothetical protein
MYVYVQVIFNNIYDLDINRQYYKADLIVETKWLKTKQILEEDRVVVEEEEDELNKQLFKIDNCLSEFKNEIILNNINKIEDNLYEIYEQRFISGLFEQEFNLNSYPFDVQTISIKLKSINDNSIYLRALNLEPRFILIKNLLNKQQWSIKNCVLTKEKYLSLKETFNNNHNHNNSNSHTKLVVIIINHLLYLIIFIYFVNQNNYTGVYYYLLY